jgi:transposase-like protein
MCVRWYLTYRLSYRDLSAMMAERDVAVSHTPIMRWVQRYVPEFEGRWARFSKPAHASWRMDETAVSVRGRLNYLYRAVDREGKSVHSLLREDRAAATCTRRRSGSSTKGATSNFRGTGLQQSSVNIADQRSDSKAFTVRQRADI